MIFTKTATINQSIKRKKTYQYAFACGTSSCPAERHGKCIPGSRKWTDARLKMKKYILKKKSKIAVNKNKVNKHYFYRCGEWRVGPNSSCTRRSSRTLRKKKPLLNINTFKTHISKQQYWILGLKTIKLKIYRGMGIVSGAPYGSFGACVPSFLESRLPTKT